MKELPECLLIQLKRFRYDSYFSSKVRTVVSFSETINVQKFSKSPVCTETYELVGFIAHQGATSGGHYVSYIKSWIDNMWYQMNDDRITSLSWDEVKNKEAYVLMYQKQILCYTDNIPSQENITGSVKIPREWLHRLKHLSSPGPVDFSAILCEHSFVDQYFWGSTVEVPQYAMNYWRQKYGVIPTIPFNLESCSACEVGCNNNFYN